MLIRASLFPEERVIGDCTLVAEIGCNHQGRIELAHEMIEAAAATGSVDYVKFQKRDIATLLSQEAYNAPHPCPEHSFGTCYGHHREHLEFSISVHRELKEHCERLGMGYACSVWDVTSAREIATLKPDYIKIPSAMNMNWQLIETVAEEFSGPLHVSLGMITREESLKILTFLREKQLLHRIQLYVCTSSYPTPASQAHLREIERLHREIGSECLGIGYSGHHLGTVLDVVAYTLGARWIERHFTMDKRLKGTDHALSLEPNEIKMLRHSLEEARQALTYRNGLTKGEIFQRQKLRDQRILCSAT